MTHLAFRLAVSSSIVTTLLLSHAHAAAASPRVQAIDPGDVRDVEASHAGSEGAASQVTDGYLYTAWHAGPGRAVGESVTLRFGATRYVTRLDVLPGHGRNNISFQRHARPAEVTVKWDGGSQRFTLEDRRKTQRLELSGLARTRSLTVTVEAIHGRAAAGVALSEIVAFEPQDVLGVHPDLRERIRDEVAALGRPADAEEAMRRIVSYGRPAIPWLRDRLAQDDPGPGGPMALRTVYAMDRAVARDVARDMLLEGTPQRVVAALKVVAEEDAATQADALFHVAKRYEQRIPELAAAALDALATAGDERALPLLDRALASGDPKRVSVAVVGLPHFGDAGRAVLGRHLEDGDEPVRLSALASLGSFGGDPEAIALAGRYAEHPSARTRMAAVKALGRLEGPHARAELGRLLDGDDDAVRRAALPALVRHGEAAMPLLRPVLAEAGEDMRARAFDELGNIRTDSVREILVEEVVAEIHPAWHRHAVRALAGQGRAGVDRMLGWVDDNPSLARRAAPFLERVADTAAPAAAEMLAAMGPDRRLDEARGVLLETIRHAGYAAAAPEVAALYRDMATSDRVRRQAMETLGHLDTPESRDLVIEEMQSPNVQLAALARQAAGRLGDERAIAPLMEMLESREVRDWPADAVQALGALRAEEALPLFRRQVPNAARGVKLAILRACERIGGRTAIRILVDASVSKDVVVSRTAQNLLGDRR
ncbi:MAG: HEAT repeat domain-containing protein [Myxococcota bacterium]